MRILLFYANPNQSIPVSPYGLETVRETLYAAGLEAEVAIVNPFIEDVDPLARLRRVLAEFVPELIGISIRNIDNAIVALSPETPPDGSPIDLVSYLPQIRRVVGVGTAWNPDVPCVVGGAGFTSCPAELLDYLELEFGLLGAAEDSFARLVAGLSGRVDRDAVAALLPRLPGAVHRTGGGWQLVPQRPSLHREPAYRPSMAPEYELLARLRGIPIAVRTKTGCPLRCTYCVDPINNRRVDARPVEHVMDDLSHYADVRGLTTFHLADAELNLPYEDHLLAICRGITARGLGDRIRWRGYFNAIPFSDQLVDAVLAAGGRSPSFAIDGFGAGLRGFGKNFRDRQAHDVLDRFLGRTPPARPEICLLLGRPGETLASVDATIDQMLRYADRGAVVAYSAGVRVYPNTPLGRDRLDPRHVYTRFGRGGPDGPHRQRDLVDAVVYCEPLPPRELLRHVQDRTRGHPRIAVFTDGPFPEAQYTEPLRYFNVGAYRLAHADFAAAAANLGRALTMHPELTPARTALDLLGSIAPIGAVN